MEIQWFPGHMTKTRRMMEEDIKLVDLVVEVVDARIPFSSKNPYLDTLWQRRPRIIALNKSDLADPGRHEGVEGMVRTAGVWGCGTRCAPQQGLAANTGAVPVPA